MHRDVVKHLNASHRADLLQIVRGHAKLTWASDATIESFDFEGLDLVAHHAERTEPQRVEFLQIADAEEQIEDRFIALLEAARVVLGVVMIEKSVSGTATRSLPQTVSSVFQCLCDVGQYPKWLPPIGQVISSSHVALQIDSSFQALARGQSQTMRIEVLEFQPNRLLHWREVDGHAHGLRFSLEQHGAGTHISVTVSNSLPIPASELGKKERQRAKLGEIIAQKLEAFMQKRAA